MCALASTHLRAWARPCSARWPCWQSPERAVAVALEPSVELWEVLQQVGLVAGLQQAPLVAARHLRGPAASSIASAGQSASAVWGGAAAASTGGCTSFEGPCRVQQSVSRPYCQHKAADEDAWWRAAGSAGG